MTVTIELIKQKILVRAMRGELVEQNPNDRPAKSLLDQVEKEKENLITKKKIRQPKPITPIDKEEIPYLLPEGWEWTLLDNISLIRRGASPRPIKKFVTDSENGIPWIKIGDSKEGSKYITTTNEKVTAEGALKSVFLESGSLIMSNSMSFGKAYILGIDGCIHDGWLSFEVPNKLINNEWLLYFLNGSFEQFDNQAVGTGVKNLNIERVRGTLIPLPPFNEQGRIVDKIESLFSLCDKWEKEVNIQYTYLSVLRDKVLDDAMRGLLVEQDENDEPIELFLKKIEEEKEKFVQEQKIKKQKPFPTIVNEEIPYTLPKEWKWMRLGEIGTIIGGGTPKTSNPKFWAENEIPWLTPADLSKHVDKYISRGKRDISLAGLNGSSARLLPAGSVLFSSRAPIGYVAIAKNDLATNQGFKSVVPYIQECNQYLYYYLKFVGNKINERASGTTFKEISGKQLSLELIAIPPIEEQQRIVKKIERLFGYIDELESHITLPK